MGVSTEGRIGIVKSGAPDKGHACVCSCRQCGKQRDRPPMNDPLGLSAVAMGEQRIWGRRGKDHYEHRSTRHAAPRPAGRVSRPGSLLVRWQAERVLAHRTCPGGGAWSASAEGAGGMSQCQPRFICSQPGGTGRAIQSAHRAPPTYRTPHDQTLTADGFTWSRVKAA